MVVPGRRECFQDTWEEVIRGDTMVNRLLLASLVSCAALHAAIARGQDARQDDDRTMLHVSQSTRVLPLAIGRQGVDTVNLATGDPATAQLVLDGRAVMEPYNVTAAAIDAGKVVAVKDGRSEAVTADNVAEHAQACAVFVQRVRAAPIEQQGRRRSSAGESAKARSMFGAPA